MRPDAYGFLKDIRDSFPGAFTNEIQWGLGLGHSNTITYTFANTYFAYVHVLCLHTLLDRSVTNI